MSLISLLALIAVGLAVLVGERIRLDRHRRAIPMLIAVTGTRGKSSVTRMLAEVLRASGQRVLAKTTGSEASLILPDGSEREIRRRGRPSIIEQKHVVRLAARLGVDTVVVEVMSIHPENHIVETRRLLRPDLVLATNFRVDHTAAVGETPEAVASVLALDVPPGVRGLVPHSECLPAFRASVEESGGEVIEIPVATAAELAGAGSERPTDWFDGNLDLVCAAARALNVDERVIGKGMGRSRGDIGSLRTWRYRGERRAKRSERRSEPSRPCYLVSAFAVNDPESTGLVLDGITAALGVEAERRIGLLSLRPDRGDRTLQWVAALREGFLERFGRLYIVGLHAQAVRRRLRRSVPGASVEAVGGGAPAETTRAALAGIRETGGMVFGFGNIAGMGEALVAYWSAAGDPVEV